MNIASILKVEARKNVISVTSQLMVKITKNQDSFALNSTVLGDIFTGSLQSPECGEILIKCLRSVEQKMNEMIAMVKTTQKSQFKGELHVNELQESADFISAKFDEYEKYKKEKRKILEDNNLKRHDKIAALKKQIDWQEKNSRRNCILLYGIPECKGEVTDNVAVKTICENINDNIITVDDIDRSHRIWKYDPQKKNPRPVIVKCAQYNVRDRIFSNNRKLKGKQISISESLSTDLTE